MERYMKSLDLAIIEIGHQISDQLKLEISISIANSLIELHTGSFKVAHNDISPMNILLNYEFDERQNLEITKIVLSDFGISSILKNSTFQLTLTSVNGHGFKLEYAAPEQMKLEPYRGMKTDVYCYGRLLNYIFFSKDCLKFVENQDL